MLCVIVLLGIKSLSCMHICGLMIHVLLNDLTFLVPFTPSVPKNVPVLSATEPRP